jgi:hypothetical protein
MWLEHLTITNAEVPTVQGSIPVSFDTVESEGRQMKQCRIKYYKNSKRSPFLGKEKKINELRKKPLFIFFLLIHIHLQKNVHLNQK